MDSVANYIAKFPEETKQRLSTLRELVFKEVPNATETISYGMPAYKLNGKPLIYFAGYNNHIGVYALPTAHGQFNEQFSEYKQGKGSVQFPINQALPIKLIKDILIFRKKELEAGK